MTSPLWRYSATGNTFLFGDNRDGEFGDLQCEEIEKLCSEANVDGLILLGNSENPKADFHMTYFNNDGGEVEMCGNGARSLLHFASQVLSINENDSGYTFTTKQSVYFGRPREDFSVQMTEIRDWGLYQINDLYNAEDSYFINTGVPHCLYLVSDVSSVPLMEVGEKIRFHDRFPGGTNVNFLHIQSENEIRLRTYERGVDGETDSCGTGATAAALMMAKNYGWRSPIHVLVNGGSLRITFSENYSEVYLAGPVDFLGKYR